MGKTDSKYIIEVEFMRKRKFSYGVSQNASEVLSTTVWEKNDSSIYKRFSYPTPSSVEY